MKSAATPVPLHEKVYLTSAEAVEYLGLPSLNALEQRMKRHTIPAWCWTRMGGKSLRFLRAALDEWLQPQERSATLREIHAADSTQRRTRRHLTKLERVG